MMKKWVKLVFLIMKKKSQKRKDTKGVPFVITDHPMLPECESMTVLLKETIIGCMLTMK